MGDTRCLTLVKQQNMIGKTFGIPRKVWNMAHHRL